MITVFVNFAGNVRIQVLCDDDTRMFHEIIAKENGIDLRSYKFCPLSLLDGMFLHLFIKQRKTLFDLHNSSNQMIIVIFGNKILLWY